MARSLPGKAVEMSGSVKPGPFAPPLRTPERFPHSHRYLLEAPSNRLRSCLRTEKLFCTIHKAASGIADISAPISAMIQRKRTWPFSKRLDSLPHSSLLNPVPDSLTSC